MSELKWTDDGRFPIFILIIGLIFPVVMIQIGDTIMIQIGDTINKIGDTINNLSSFKASEQKPGAVESALSGTLESSIINEKQLLTIIKGCCSGSGGTYSPSGQDCIVSNRNAFTSCVGSGKVRYSNGNEYDYSGNKFAR